MSKKLVLIGGGGHALSLLDIIPSPIVATGYVDSRPSRLMELPWLGDDAGFLDSCAPDDHEIMVTMVSGADCNLARRASIIDMYRRYPSPVIISSSAIISPSATIGDGTAIFHRAVVNAGTRIGRHSIINTGAIIEHECTIGDNVFIGPGAVICGGVTIGDNAYIGAGATLKPGISISGECVIGLASAVIADIKSPGTYAGSPAKRLHD